MHADLINALRTITPDLPDGLTPAQAWRHINPDRHTFVRGSFVRGSLFSVLAGALPFAHSHAQQEALAAWVFRQKARAEKSGRAWPPVKLITKPAFTPQPHQ